MSFVLEYCDDDDGERNVLCYILANVINVALGNVTYMTLLGDNLAFQMNALRRKAGCTLSSCDRFCIMLALKQGHRCNPSSENVTPPFQPLVYSRERLSTSFDHSKINK